MCKQSDLKTRQTAIEKNASPHYSTVFTVWVSVACACMLYAQNTMAAGGCGSVCLPLEVFDLDNVLVPKSITRYSIITARAKFDKFKEGDDLLTNPGGNKATITQTTFLVDYGITRRWTISLLLPYITKKQETNKFGTRTAQGLGDVSLFGRYELVSGLNRFKGKSVSLGLGIKFPTGSIDEPSTSNRLPPAFQSGSGAYDIVPTLSFNKALGNSTLFGGIVWRLPVEKNKRGYKFGQEFKVNFGINYPSPFYSQKLSFQLSSTYLTAKKDTDSNLTLPAKLRNGSTVLNTGGEFLDITPGFRWKFSDAYSLQARFSIPVYENWNGNRATNVGQVTPSLTTQLTLTYTGL